MSALDPCDSLLKGCGGGGREGGNRRGGVSGEPGPQMARGLHGGECGGELQRVRALKHRKSGDVLSELNVEDVEAPVLVRFRKFEDFEVIVVHVENGKRSAVRETSTDIRTESKRPIRHIQLYKRRTSGVASLMRVFGGYDTRSGECY
jgi:hypothetical protein